MRVAECRVTEWAINVLRGVEEGVEESDSLFARGRKGM
jgi:hypothetical protein